MAPWLFYLADTGRASRSYSIAINLNYHYLPQFYESGILNAGCSSNFRSKYGQVDVSRFDHAVVVVGYGEDSAGRKYWKLKNSWGSDWGHGGFELGYPRHISLFFKVHLPST